MRLLRKILFPFSILYGGIILFRNELYNKNIFKSNVYQVPTICVGNLSMGGTGKSPMVEYLVSFLKKDYKVAVLSRGYKRKTKGFYLLKGNEKASEVGDEPLQFKSKFPNLTVAVDEDRSHGIEKLLELGNTPEIILLDDAFQHRKVQAKLNILLTSYKNLFVDDFIVPTGNLREPARGAKRANIVMVTKCPNDLGEEQKNKIKNKLDIDADQFLFFSSIDYSEKIFNLSSSFPLFSLKGKPLTLVTGIANPEPLVKFLAQQELDFEHISFPDHHNFTSQEIKMMNEKGLILTTEKDFMRLKGEVPDQKLFFLPIKTQIIGEGEKERFQDLIKMLLKKE